MAAWIHPEAWLSVKLPIKMYVTVTLDDPNKTVVNEGLFILDHQGFGYPNTPYGGGGIKVGDLWVTWIFEGEFVNYIDFVKALN